MSRSTEKKEKNERKNMERMLLLSQMQGSLSLDLVYAEYLVFFHYSQGLDRYLRAR